MSALFSSPAWDGVLEAAAEALTRRVLLFSAADRQPVPVPHSWARPVARWLLGLEEIATRRNVLDLADIEAHLAGLPGLLDEMDHDALATVLEEGMARKVVSAAGAALAKAGARLEPFAAGLPGVAFGPLAEAVAKLDRKSPLAVKLSSSAWEKVPLAIRERGQFSARVASVRLLQFIQDRTRAALDWQMDRIAAGKAAAGGEAFVDRSVFIAEARRIAIEEGLDTTTPDKYGTVRDIRSAKRLGLIWDMQTNQAREYARWKADNDPDVLDAYPAQRLVRIEDRLNPRPPWFWPSRWSEAFTKVAGAGAADREMVALKTSPIWAALSRFGTPWPPFDYGSGMGLEDVGRAKAEALGLMEPDHRLAPAEDPGLNVNLEANVDDLAPELAGWLARSFPGAASVENGVLRWTST